MGFIWRAGLGRVCHCSLWLSTSPAPLLQGAGGKHGDQTRVTRKLLLFPFPSFFVLNLPALPKAGWRGLWGCSCCCGPPRQLHSLACCPHSLCHVGVLLALAVSSPAVQSKHPGGDSRGSPILLESSIPAPSLCRPRPWSCPGHLKTGGFAVISSVFYQRKKGKEPWAPLIDVDTTWRYSGSVQGLMRTRSFHNF